MSDSVCVAIFLDVIVILLFNVMELLSVVIGGICIYHVWSSKECMCCACDHRVHLDVLSICFVCICVCRKLSPHLRAGSQVFALLMLFLCDVAYYVVG